jgi:tetratricopeptide (TPR) repeat protein
MRGVFLILIFFFFSKYAKADTLTVNRKIDDLEFRLRRFENNELNYKLEKDLLKETYSNNYERINLVITVALGVIGILGYLGIRDISSIKKEYEKELNNLRQIQGQFKTKSEELDKDKKKLEDDLKAIIKENEEQSRRIKFIELKEKIHSLIKDDKLTSALEFSNAALDLSKNDIDVLNLKGTILSRLNQFNEAVETFQRALIENPTNTKTIFNAAECFYFGKDITSAKKLIEEHKMLFESKENGKLLEMFDLLELYQSANKDKLIDIAKGYIDINNLTVANKRMNNWDLKDALYFAHYQPEGELKNILQNIIWYWDGQIDGVTLLTRLSIELPKPTEINE